MNKKLFTIYFSLLMLLQTHTIIHQASTKTTSKPTLNKNHIKTYFEQKPQYYFSKKKKKTHRRHQPLLQSLTCTSQEPFHCTPPSSGHPWHSTSYYYSTTKSYIPLYPSQWYYQWNKKGRIMQN